jgi:hypothetical protein
MEENGVAIISEKLGDFINGLDEEPFQGAKVRIATLKQMGPEVLKFGVAWWPALRFYGLDFGWGSVRWRSHRDKKKKKKKKEERKDTDVLSRPEMEPFVECFSLELHQPQKDTDFCNQVLSLKCAFWCFMGSSSSLRLQLDIIIL